MECRYCYRMRTLPVIEPWNVHRYLYVPRFFSFRLQLPVFLAPQFLGFAPLGALVKWTLCRRSPFHFHVTEVGLEKLLDRGLKKLSFTPTDLEAALVPWPAMAGTATAAAQSSTVTNANSLTWGTPLRRWTRSCQQDGASRSSGRRPAW